MSKTLERFGNAILRLQELIKKYPKIKTAIEIGYICGMVNSPLSPIYDDEETLNKKFEQLEELLKQL